MEHGGIVIGPDTHYLDHQGYWRLCRKRRAFLSNNVIDQKNDRLEIRQGDCVLVRNDEISELDPGEHSSLQFWKAKIWEIRAIDKHNVFALVSWFDRPDDLPGGRQAYHGRYELIATTQMAIIHADTIQETVSIKHWDENDADPDVGQKEYYWRQIQAHDLKSLTVRLLLDMIYTVTKLLRRIVRGFAIVPHQEISTKAYGHAFFAESGCTSDVP